MGGELGVTARCRWQTKQSSCAVLCAVERDGLLLCCCVGRRPLHPNSRSAACPVPDSSELPRSMKASLTDNIVQKLLDRSHPDCPYKPLTARNAGHTPYIRTCQAALKHSAALSTRSLPHLTSDNAAHSAVAHPRVTLTAARCPAAAVATSAAAASVPLAARCPTAALLRSQCSASSSDVPHPVARRVRRACAASLSLGSVVSWRLQ